MSDEADTAARGPSGLTGLYFEDFGVEQVYRSPGRTITEGDIAAFAGLSGDYNPLHTDEEYARRTPYRGRVAHGLLVQAVSTGLASRIGVFEGTVAALQEMIIRYRAPVRPGDTVRLELRVLDIDPEPARRRGWVRFESRVINQADEVVIDGEWRTLLHRRRAAARGGAG